MKKQGELTHKEAVKKALEDTKANLHNLELESSAKKSQNALKSLDAYKDKISNNAIVSTTDVSDSNLLKDMAQAMLNNYSLDLVMLASADDSKCTFVCATSAKYNASNMVKEAASICGGGGGGKPTLAQAGGKNPAKVMEALDHIKDLLK